MYRKRGHIKGRGGRGWGASSSRNDDDVFVCFGEGMRLSSVQPSLDETAPTSMTEASMVVIA